jgi:membrane-associated PAP2 superfamily phosphatase
MPSYFILIKVMNQIKSWLVIMSSVSLLGITVLGIQNPDKYGRNIVDITMVLLTSVITLAKQNDEPPKKP